MKILIDTYKNTGTIHHAYLIEGFSEIVMPDLFDFVKKNMKIEIHGNPDFTVSTYDTFTIDDGRMLQERQSQRSFSEKKIFILNLQFITSEAQNALLKVFEEPTQGTHFFIITPTAQILLPTLRSRLQIISRSDEVQKTETKHLNFLKANQSERLALLKEIIEEKDKTKAIDFVSGLERVLGKQKPINAKAIEEVLTAKKYLHDRSPSIKLLLEHLALVL